MFNLFITFCVDGFKNYFARQLEHLIYVYILRFKKRYSGCGLQLKSYTIPITPCMNSNMLLKPKLDSEIQQKKKK